MGQFDGIPLRWNFLLETICWKSATPPKENLEDIAAFKERYRFAFPTEPPPLNYSQPESRGQFAAEEAEETAIAAATGSYF